MTPLAPLAPLQSEPTTTGGTGGSSSANSTAAYGLSFDALLKIILTQLTYQDPLKPMDNFEFVSQLGQFAQIQQGDTTNDRLESLVMAQATSQATSLLGSEVDVPSGTSVLKGVVTAIAFESGVPRITITDANGEKHFNIAMSDVNQVRLVEGQEE